MDADSDVGVDDDAVVGVGSDEAVDDDEDDVGLDEDEEDVDVDAESTNLVIVFGCTTTSTCLIK